MGNPDKLTEKEKSEEKEIFIKNIQQIIKVGLWILVLVSVSFLAADFATKKTDQKHVYYTMPSYSDPFFQIPQKTVNETENDIELKFSYIKDESIHGTKTITLTPDANITYIKSEKNAIEFDQYKRFLSGSTSYAENILIYYQ